MKKKASYILAFISFIGSMVTIYTDNTVQNIAKNITFFAICILGIIIIYTIGNYLTNWIEKFKEFMDTLVDIKELSNSITSINKISENMATLNKKVIELDKILADMSQKNMNFNLTCNQAWKDVKDFQEKIIEKLDSKSYFQYRTKIEKLDGKSYFQYRTTDVTVQLIRLLDTQKEIDEIHIICFGRSGYGEVAQYIAEKKLPIKIKIIICNPQKNEFIHSNNDISKIKELIKVMHQNGAEVYLSNIPPTVRASTAYVHKNAIWSVMQSYQFNRGINNELELMRPKDSQDSLIIVGDEHSSKQDFDGIVKCFESEFKRLLKNSVHLKVDNLQG